MQRLWNLFVGWFNRYIYQMEAANPEVVYDNAINQVIVTYKLLKEKAAAVVRRADELEMSVNDTRKSFTKVSDLLENAAYLPEAEVNLDAAAEMIKTKDQLKEKLDGLMDDLKIAQQDEAEVTQALRDVESEKNKLVAEKDANIGRYRAAQARLEIMERQDGTSINAINQSLTGVRGNISNVIAEANLTKQLQSETLENKVKEFTAATEGQSAKQKFLQMREAARQQSAGAEVLNKALEAKQQPEKVNVAADTKTA